MNQQLIRYLGLWSCRPTCSTKVNCSETNTLDRLPYLDH